MLFKKCIIFLILSFCAFSIFAQKQKGKVYTVNFEDEFIEGHIKNPTIFHLFNKQQLEYDKLVDLKEDFLPEMRRTAGEIE